MKKPVYSYLYVQVVAGILIGGAIGLIWPQIGAQPWMKAIGDAFVNLLKMMIAVLIFCTVVSGIGHVRQASQVGRVGLKAIVYFEVLSSVALVLGLAAGNLLHPGAGLNLHGDAAAVAQYARKSETLSGFLMGLIPTSFLSGLVNGDVLQTLVVAVLSGFALMRLGDRAAGVRDLVEQGSRVIFDIVAIIMRAAPLGAGAAMAFTLGTYGVSALGHLIALVGTFYATSLTFILVVLGIVAALCGFSILRFLAYIRDELLIILGTSSSESALASLMDKMERLGCSKPVVGLVVPTGYSFNLDGTNIYMTLACLFIAQAMNVPLTLQQQLTIVAVAMLTSKGASGVTGAGFVTLGATLAVVSPALVPGMAIILGIDKFMSECRALTNFVGNGVACIVISRWEGELDRAKLKAGLSGHSETATQP